MGALVPSRGPLMALPPPPLRPTSLLTSSPPTPSPALLLLTSLPPLSTILSSRLHPSLTFPTLPLVPLTQPGQAFSPVTTSSGLLPETISAAQAPRPSSTSLAFSTSALLRTLLLPLLSR